MLDLGVGLALLHFAGAGDDRAVQNELDAVLGRVDLLQIDREPHEKEKRNGHQRENDRDVALCVMLQPAKFVDGLLCECCVFHLAHPGYGRTWP